jgi:hypothetical protein
MIKKIASIVKKNTFQEVIRLTEIVNTAVIIRTEIISFLFIIDF